jgi:hypothetical protein
MIELVILPVLGIDRNGFNLYLPEIAVDAAATAVAH